MQSTSRAGQEILIVLSLLNTTSLQAHFLQSRIISCQTRAILVSNQLRGQHNTEPSKFSTGRVRTLDGYSSRAALIGRNLDNQALRSGTDRHPEPEFTTRSSGTQLLLYTATVSFLTRRLCPCRRVVPAVGRLFGSRVKVSYSIYIYPHPSPMTALDPFGFTRPNGGSPAPTTPRGQASKEVNIVIESIAQEFGLPLKPRIGTFSPSKRVDGYAERCVDHINFLFFRNRTEMYNVINTFRQDRRSGYIHGQLLDEFYSRTRDAAHMERDRQPLGKLRLETKVTGPEPQFRKPAPRLSLKQTKLITTIKKSSTSSHLINPDAHKHDSLLPANQSFIPDAHVSRGTKRHSGQDLFNSPQYVRPFKQMRQQPHTSDCVISYKASTSVHSLSSSHQTTAPSISTGRSNQSFATTVATSSNSANEPWESSGTEYGDDDLDHSQVDRLMTSFEVSEESCINPQDTFSFTAKSSGMHAQAPVTRSDLYTIEANNQLQVDHKATLQIPSPKSKPRTKVLEHRIVRTLSTDGLFGLPVAADLTETSFHQLWESYRFAAASGTTFEYYPRQDWLYKQIPSGSQFQRTSTSVWEATTDPAQASNVILKGSLSFNASASAERLFTLSLQPLKLERASRLQRKFGSSRFLYLEMPQIHTIKASHLKGQESLLKSRLQEWMCTEKSLLGRTWRIFHIQDIKRKHNKDNLPSQRLVLFAVDGPQLQTISLTEMLNWAIPLSTNMHQGFCKAYARLDLFLSQTIPAVNFNFKEVEYVQDMFADGTPECAEFNDPLLRFDYRYGPLIGKSVMNDGCSRISVGAAKELCELLGIKGVRPSAFQGRINGCKGVWMISAPYDTSDPKHLERWIQISQSQRKVTPRLVDLTPECEPDRWSFELVKYTSTPKSSTLSLEFIPILQDRHVSRDTLQQVLESQLEMDFSAFLESLNDPVSLRRWLHSEFSGMEEINRAIGIRQTANFPSDGVEKSILLLESGFNPMTHQYLASCIQQVANLWLSSIRSKLKINLGMSAMALGVADPTGCLQPGEIHMAFSETFRDEVSGQVWPHLKGEILVARHPSLRCSDIQKVKAVYKEELSHLTDIVVFPSKGCIPLAHKLQGGDYDGDTFWLCWDPRLTTDFKNAPAPMEEAKPEYFGIKEDTRKLGDVLGSGNNVDKWLSESFKFKLQEDLLGKATKLHGKLAYKENSISSKKVEELASLHDLVIDSAKNGYTFTLRAFNEFAKKKLGIKGNLDKPAYESWMDPKDSNVGRLKPNMRHIIDYLLFEVVNPRIEQFTKQCQEKLSFAETRDEDLERPYLERRNKADLIMIEVLDKMNMDLKKVNNIGVQVEKMTKEVWEAQANRALESYTAIRPIHAEDRVVQEWLRRTTPNSLTTWELIKASAFYIERHKRMALVFLCAGKELCHIKALATTTTMGGESRLVVADVYGVYKPRREKKLVNKRQVPLPVVESSESSEEEFFDAVG
jgi:hypothetical protein